MSKGTLEKWLNCQELTVGKHTLRILRENASTRALVMDSLRAMLRSHYVDPRILAKQLKAHGAPKTAELVRQKLPVSSTARSGDLGEILATELVEGWLGYRVPVRRLQWKDGRDNAMRGDDLVGVRVEAGGRLWFLKGESKSRAKLAKDALDAAITALDRDRGRPGRFSVNFIADRLRAQEEDGLATQLEDALLGSFAGCVVEHAVLTLSGNDPEKLLTARVRSRPSGARTTHIFGVKLDDHGGFVAALYEGF